MTALTRGRLAGVVLTVGELGGAGGNEGLSFCMPAGPPLFRRAAGAFSTGLS